MPGHRRSIFVLSLVLAAAMPAAAEEALVLTGARLLRPDGEGYIEGRAVWIANGRISRIVSAAQAPEGAATLDLSGLTLVPGLIDLHSHLLLHPYDEASWNDQVLTEQLELRVLRAVPAARKTLEAGFTTLRELGTEGAAYADVALRDALARGIVPGPRLFVATRAIVATGAYGPAGFDPRWQPPKGAQVADGPVEVRRAVREQIAAGADWIKVYADYRRRPGDPSTPTLAADEAIRRAVSAGVRTIEHGTGASAEVLASMREKGVVLCPTLAASEAISRYGGWRPGEPEPPRLAASRQLMERALASGVTIALGSDVGVFAHGDNAREMELMEEYGMSPAAVLHAATDVAAAVLGRGSDLGRVAEGYVADLVAVSGDPLAGVAVLRRPVVVLVEGRVVFDGRAEGH